MRGLTLLWAAGLLLAAAGTPLARAHGRFPETGQIAFHPTDPDLLVVRTTFGLLVSRDNGESWGWVCREALDIGVNDDPALTVMSDGSIVAAAFAGLSRSTDSACSFVYPEPALMDEVVIDVVRHPTDPRRAFAMTSPGADPNRIYTTADDGATWQPTALEIAPAGYLSERVVVAPSDPERLYVSGAVPPGPSTPRTAKVYRSPDGGDSWEELPFPLREELDRNIYVLGVDPTDPERLFMRVRHDPDSDAPDRLMESIDGGETFEVALEMEQIRGFAWSADGSTVWVGGVGGLFRSTDGGDNFQPLDPDLTVGCLAVRGDELYVCAQNWVDDMAVGRSMDGGDSITPILVFDEAIHGPLDCPAEAPTTAMCSIVFPDLQRDLSLAGSGMFPDGGIPPPGDGGSDGGLDGGPGDAGPPGGGGGCCAAAPGRRLDGGPALAALVLLVVVRRRQKRRR